MVDKETQVFYCYIHFPSLRYNNLTGGMGMMEGGNILNMGGCQKNGKFFYNDDIYNIYTLIFSSLAVN